LFGLIGDKRTGAAYLLDQKLFLSFIRCGWCATDSPIDHSYWDSIESAALLSMKYDATLNIPINITNTKNLTSRKTTQNAVKICKERYNLFRILPGQKKALADFRAEFSRTESVQKVIENERREEALDSQIGKRKEARVAKRLKSIQANAERQLENRSIADHKEFVDIKSEIAKLREELKKKAPIDSALNYSMIPQVEEMKSGVAKLREDF
jgi:oligoribonuclease NrnB/cAMP/cGMP phosphodiesterase (DHH superfamily)